MGIFSQMNNTSGAAPAFDGSRWEPVLRSMDIKFGTDDEGDHFGDWDGARVWFEAKGEQREILVVRAVMDVRPPLDAYASVALVANDWNGEHMWPRTYVVRTDTECVIVADLVIDLETGASDDFLRQQVRCALSTAFEFAEHLPKVLPESAGWRNVGAE